VIISPIYEVKTYVYYYGPHGFFELGQGGPKVYYHTINKVFILLWFRGPPSKKSFRIIALEHRFLTGGPARGVCLWGPQNITKEKFVPIETSFTDI